MKPVEHWLTRVCRPVLETIFPPVCQACETWLDFRWHPASPNPRRATQLTDQYLALRSQVNDLWWCEVCLAQMVSAAEHCCPYCHACSPQERFRQQRCRLCRDSRLRFDAALAIGNYQGILQEQVLRMKGVRDEPLAWQFGRLLAAKRSWVAQIDSSWQRIDLVIPIPVHWWKRLQRGFHASQLIAEGFCSVSGEALSANALHYRRLTSKQGLLNTKERFRNVVDAFGVNPRVPVAGKHLLLVDDVMTSGATLAYATAALKRSGALTVRAAVLARGTRHRGT